MIIGGISCDIFVCAFVFTRTLCITKFRCNWFDGNIKRAQIVFRVNGPFSGEWGQAAHVDSKPEACRMILDIQTEGYDSRNYVLCLNSDQTVIWSAFILNSSWSTIKQHFEVVKCLII